MKVDVLMRLLTIEQIITDTGMIFILSDSHTFHES